MPKRNIPSPVVAPDTTCHEGGAAGVTPALRGAVVGVVLTMPCGLDGAQPELPTASTTPTAARSSPLLRLTTAAPPEAASLGRPKGKRIRPPAGYWTRGRSVCLDKWPAKNGPTPAVGSGWDRRVPDRPV